MRSGKKKRKGLRGLNHWYWYMQGRPVTLIFTSMRGGVLEALPTCFGRNSRYRLLFKLVGESYFS